MGRQREREREREEGEREREREREIKTEKTCKANLKFEHSSQSQQVVHNKVI